MERVVGLDVDESKRCAKVELTSALNLPVVVVVAFATLSVPVQSKMTSQRVSKGEAHAGQAGSRGTLSCSTQARTQNLSTRTSLQIDPTGDLQAQSSYTARQD